MKENLTKQYPISKTLRFKLIPVGSTEANFNKKNILENDEERAKNYQEVKKYMDSYHEHFIESVLSNLKIDVSEYATLYNKKNKTNAETNSMAKMEANLRKAISEKFKNDNKYSNLFKQEFVKNILPGFLTKKEERDIVARFNDFCTYFTGFFENRKNMYTDEEKSTGIAYRCINDNLPKFLDNVRSFSEIRDSLPQSDIDSINEAFPAVQGSIAEDVFSVNYFSFVLSQNGIETYNRIIGEFNRRINNYNQHNSRKKLPILKPLFKQILSDNDSEFIKEFKSDDEVLEAIKKFYKFYNENIEEIEGNISKLFSQFDSFNAEGIHLKSGVAVTNLSNAVFDSWNIIKDLWFKFPQTVPNPARNNLTGFCCYWQLPNDHHDRPLQIIE